MGPCNGPVSDISPRTGTDLKATPVGTLERRVILPTGASWPKDGCMSPNKLVADDSDVVLALVPHVIVGFGAFSDT
jgi:hypothetical protein